jgi:hypothetical protein
MIQRPTIQIDGVYATSPQHDELCQQICCLLNRRAAIGTTTRLCLLDFIISIRPSPETRLFRLDLRTYGIIHRVLNQIGDETDLSERHFLQDVLRWTIDCHRERVWSRVRSWGGGRGRTMGSSVSRGRTLVNRITDGSSGTRRITDGNVRCRRCHQDGLPFDMLT